MKCSNCGTENESDNEFCSQCGTNLKITIDTMEEHEENETMTEPINNEEDNNKVDIVNNDDNINESVIKQNESNNNQQYIDNINMFEEYNPNDSLIYKLKNFLLNHIRLVGALILIGIFIIIGTNLYNTLHDGTKINWKKNEGYEVVSVTPSGKVNLEVEAYDEMKNEINDIEYKVSGGEIDASGRKVIWTLPSKEGKYTITASSPSGKKIKRSIQVKKFENDKSYTAFGYKFEEEKTDDYDKDGLKNDEEKKLGTNPRSKDTDHDGLNDYYEVNTSKTDPLKPDTDGDGLNDSDELVFKLNPLKEDSKGDGLKDGDRSLSYNTNYNKEISLQVNGKGNIASTTTIDVFENTAFNKINGISNRVYVFYTKGKMDNAVVTIKYDIKDINKKGLNEKNLVLYYFNEETKKFEPQEVKLNAKNKTITAKLSHFSKYVLGDNTLVSKDNSANIMFVIDNSISMYSLKQLKDAGYSSTGAVGNDKDFKRITLTNDMVKKFTGNYKFGVAEFSGNYVNLEKFTTDKDKVTKSVDSMKLNWKSNATGTDIIGALNSGIEEYKDISSDNDYIILLTDGKNTKGSFDKSTQDNIIKKAKEKNIKVCTIGLGDVDSSALRNISEQTGCGFYSASSSTTLDEIYTRLGADINYNLVDTNKDNKIDGTVIADSGFIVTRDGFSFANYGTTFTSGHCYGMAAFAMLYYTKKLPTTLAPNKYSKDIGYDLKNTYFSSYKTLYDYAVHNDTLKMYLSGNVPDDYRYEERAGCWKIASKYKEKFENIGFDISMNNKKESALLNISSDKFKKNVVREDRELLNTIWRLYKLQSDSTKIPFESEPDKAYNSLFSNLNSGNPILLLMRFKSDDGFDGHAVNAIRLIQHNDNPNLFEIEIYDSNYPGESKYVSMQRYKSDFFLFDKNTWNNNYEYVLTYDNWLLYTNEFHNEDDIGAYIGELNIK